MSVCVGGWGGGWKGGDTLTSSRKDKNANVLKQNPEHKMFIRTLFSSFFTF